MDITSRLQTIREKITKLKNKDKHLAVFGAGDDPYYKTIGHHYDLRPTLTEEQLSSMEEIMKQRFPEEYREFLKQVSNGGVGPFWGLYPLESAVLPPKLHDQYPDFCKTPFPYTKADAERIIAIQTGENPNYYEAINKPLSGYIKLSNYGHVMYFILVVSGEQAGTVWFLNEEGTIAPCYHQKNGTPKQVSFLDWYENWLDDNLEQGAIPDDPNVPFEHPEEIFTINYTRQSLRELPKHIFACKNLKTLIVETNKLKKLPPEIKNFAELEYINAFMNELESLPKEIGELKKLTTLLLKTNYIKELPQSIGNLENLLDLYLGFNQLSELPESIGNLKKLEFLNLEYTGISALPDSLKNLTNLKEIVLTGSKISEAELQRVKEMVPWANVVF